MVRKNKGFSLMELMMTIAVFAVLAAIATPNAISWIRNSQFNSSVRKIKTDVEKARMYAVKNNARVEITFNGDDYQIDRLNRITGANDTIAVNLEPGTLANFNNGTLTYNSRGMGAVPGTVTIQGSNGLCSDIVISPEGSSRIQECP